MTPVQPDAALLAAVRASIRDVPDFPKPGILFKDITPLLAEGTLFREVTAYMARRFADARPSHVVAIESRGFMFGAPVAQQLRAGLVPLRKPGKLPAAALRHDYALEYGTDALEVHADALGTDSRVLVVDDVLATGGTAAAACALVERAGATVVGCSFLIELAALAGRTRLAGRAVDAMVTY
jgi:adenine phosphoribosyltransferase